MAAFLANPCEFLYYVRNRVNGSDHFRATSEKALLGCHLSHNLLPRRRYAFGLVQEDYAHRLDADFRALRGLQPPHPSGTYQVSWWNSGVMDEVAALLKDQTDPESMEALFAWYDVCDNAPDMARFIDEARHRCVQTGHDSDFSLEFDGFGISYQLFAVPHLDIPERVGVHVMARKYKARADAWLGLAGVVGAERSAVLATWQSYPWKLDPEMDLLVRDALRPGTPI